MMDDLYAELESFEIPYKRDVNIGKLTWYGVGGSADCLAHPQSIEQLQTLTSYCEKCAIELRILGAGANLLVRDKPIKGVVISLDSELFKQIDIEYKKENSALIRVKAGCDLFKLVQYAARNGLSGLEQVAGIPATVGGAVCMNAGGKYGDISDSLKQIKTITRSGDLKTIESNQLKFGYRYTNIKDPIIVEASFELTGNEPKQVRKKVKEIFSYKKNSQPMADNSAGCAFKNPPNQHAGKLIDETGLKGYSIGAVTVSTVHANFITINDQKNRSAEDAAKLIEQVQKLVLQKTGADLEREVKIWPDDR